MKSAFVSLDINGLLSLGTSFQAGYVLFESVRIGLFDAAGGRPVTSATLAGRLEVSLDALSRLLNTLVSMGLMERKGNCYRNTELSSRYLCKSGKNYAGDYFIHLESLNGQWSGLKDSLQTNKMVRPEEKRISAYSKQLKKFLLAMHALGSIRSKHILKKIRAGSYRNMLDVGGGMGTYAVEFARENNSLNATVFELEPVVKHAKKYIKQEGMHDRIKVFAGQCVEGQLPNGPYDLVLISNLLHVYNSQDCITIINKASDALSEKGTLLIHDYIFGVGDESAACLFDMTMLVGTPHGRCYRRVDIEGWMRSCGIVDMRTSEIPGGTAIVWGKKSLMS